MLWHIISDEQKPLYLILSIQLWHCIVLEVRGASRRSHLELGPTALAAVESVACCLLAKNNNNNNNYKKKKTCQTYALTTNDQVTAGRNVCRLLRLFSVIYNIMRRGRTLTLQPHRGTCLRVFFVCLFHISYYDFIFLQVFVSFVILCTHCHTYLYLHT